MQRRRTSRAAELGVTRPISFDPTDPRKPNLDLGKSNQHKGSSLDKDESEEPNREFGEATSAGAVYAEQQPARRMRVDMEQLEAREARRKRLFEQDALGRTSLFQAAEKGLEEEVREIIFSLRGTGLGPPRLSLITTKDQSALTAADVAEQRGHKEIARLLRVEQGRMEYYE